jgi:serine/threonine protein kinase
LPPGTRLGRYVVVDRIGQGGMAEVHLARAEGLSGFEKVVALKVIHGHLVDDPMHVELLLKEARIAATLDHPSIVQVFDVGVETGEYYLTMEYVHGVDARQILRALSGRARMPILHALLVVHEVAAALHYAHTRRDPQGRPLGIVHRDVSPSNVIIAFDGAVKLTDFGIAKVTAHTSHTTTGTLKGKFGYMSPEQSMQQEVDARSDVFALGVLLYELTTGRRAFAGESAFATMNAVIEGHYTPPQELVPDYPASLAAIVERALAVDREARYDSADALRIEIDALARELGGPATLPELGRWVGDLFEWPAMPDVSAVFAPLELGGETELLTDPVIIGRQSRRRSPVVFASVGVGVIAMAIAGYAGWQAGRSTGGEVATAPAIATTTTPPITTTAPTTTTPTSAPTSASASAPMVAVVESEASERSSNKRKRRRPSKRKSSATSSKPGIDSILPPSARRDP